MPNHTWLLKKASTTLALLLAVLVCVIIFKPHTTNAVATIPYKINFQGRLTDNNGNVVANGTYNIKFTIYNALTAGTNLWQEFRQTTNRVTITNGLFDVRFGDVTALSPSLFNSATQLYLEVELPTPASATCSTSNCGVFTEGPLSPRQPIAASPYAFNSDTIDGIDGVNIAQLNQSNTFTANQIVSGSLTATSLFQGANTVCDVSNNCSFAAASGSANYIQNGTSQQTANMNISGNGTFGGNVVAAGTLSASNFNQTNYSVDVPATTTDAIEFATVTNTNFSSNVELWFTVHSAFYAQSKRYIVPVQYNGTAGAWQKALPISSTGAYSGNDAAIDVKVLGQTATFRIRRTAGVTAGTAKITLAIGGDTAGTTVAPSSTTYASQTVAVNYAPTSLTMINGKTGINNDSPTAFLDVNGTFNVSGQTTLTTTSSTGLTVTGGTYLATTGGNVGIGTATPSEKLDVSGKIALDGTVIAYRPTTMTGTLILGDGGTNLLHTAGVDGYYNTFVGLGSGNANTTGNQNSAQGYGSLRFNTTGSYNSAQGVSSLRSNTTGIRNSAQGFASLYSNTTGNYNTAQGVNSLYDLNILDGTGNNTALGYNTGRGIVTGINNTILGANVTGLSAALSNNIIIADGGGNQRINVDATGNVGIGTATPGARLNVVGNGLFSGSITGASLFQGANQVCDASNSCNYASASGSGNYIQNGTSAQTANLNITGSATAATFSGSGASLTALNGSSISTGTVADARLSTNVALQNGTNTFTANNTFNGSVAIGGAASGAQLQATTTSASTVGLVVQGAASQTADLAQFKNSAGTGLLRVRSDGNIQAENELSIYAAGITTPHVVFGEQFGISVTTFNSLTLFTSPGATVVPLIVKGAASQFADLLQVLDSSNTELFTVNSSGNVTIGSSTESAKLAVINNGSGQYGMIVRGSSSQLSTPIFSVQSSSSAELLGVGPTGTLTVRPLAGVSSLVVNDSLGNNVFVVNSAGKIVMGTGGAAFGAIKKLTTNVDFPATANGAKANRTYQFATDVVVTGVQIPSSTALCGGFGCTLEWRQSNISNNSLPRLIFEFLNGSGAAVNPTAQNWTIWYIEP